MISVHIAASSAIVRAGLESVVRSTEGLCLASVDSADSLEQALEYHPDGIAADTLLVSLSRLTEDWIALIASASLPTVILADATDPSLFTSALHAGIRAVLSPDAGPAEIAAALIAASAGLIALHPLSLDLLHREAPPSRDDLAAPLTPRELEVLGLLAEGHSNKLIAQSLAISEHTVKFHVTAILNKLQSASRTDAVMQGIRRGLIMI